MTYGNRRSVEPKRHPDPPVTALTTHVTWITPRGNSNSGSRAWQPQRKELGPVHMPITNSGTVNPTSRAEEEPFTFTLRFHTKHL